MSPVHPEWTEGSGEGEAQGEALNPVYKTNLILNFIDTERTLYLLSFTNPRLQPRMNP